MKKCVALGLGLMVAACSWQRPACEKKLDTEKYFVESAPAPVATWDNAQPVYLNEVKTTKYEPVVVSVDQNIPEPVATWEKAQPIYLSQVKVEVKTEGSCGAEKEATCTSCQYKPEPCRELLRPRVTEVKVTKSCRDCPVDTQAVICGNSTCRTFANAEPAAPSFRTTVPAMPQAYVLAAGRTFNRMQKSVAPWCSGAPKLYVQIPQVVGTGMPAGVQQGVTAMKNKVASTSLFSLTDNVSSADYILETSVDWFDTPTKKVPAIQYKTVLFDKNHNKIDEWVEIVRQANNRSWL